MVAADELNMVKTLPLLPLGTGAGQDTPRGCVGPGFGHRERAGGTHVQPRRLRHAVDIGHADHRPRQSNRGAGGVEFPGLMVGQLPRVRGRTPGLPPRGVPTQVGPGV